LSESKRYSRIGVLDIGSNSVRLVIYQLYGSSFSPVYNEKDLAGLGRDLRLTGRLSEQGRVSALAALRRFAVLSKAQRLDSLLVGATAALREAKDAKDFIDEVRIETGLDIRPVSGAEEARLTAMGVIAAEYRADGIAADLGGASLEIININKGVPEPGVSFPIGPFQILGQDLSAADYDIPAIKSRIYEHLSAQDMSPRKGRPLYLIGGAWRNLAGIHQKQTDYPLRTLQGYTLTPNEARDLAVWAYGDGHEDVIAWPGISTKRAETLPYSAIMLDVLIGTFKPSKIIISSTGLREGLVYDNLPDNHKARDSLYDGCRDLARGNLQDDFFGVPLYKFLSEASKKFPQVFETENEERVRRAACSLVGIGKGLHPDYRADLVFENVLYAPLSDLSHKERAYLALILFTSYTAKSSTPNNAAMAKLLTEEEQHAARAYGFAVRLAVVASGRSGNLLELFNLKWADAVLEFSVRQDYSQLMTQRVTYRLDKLATVLGTSARVTN